MQDTSLEAFLSTDREAGMKRVSEYIRLTGSFGATDDEVEIALGMLHQTASARRGDLVKSGDVAKTTERRKTRTGRSAIVWKSIYRV